MPPAPTLGEKAAAEGAGTPLLQLMRAAGLLSVPGALLCQGGP